jgi:integrase
MGKQRNPNGMGSYKKRKSDGRHEWHRTINGDDQYLSAKTSSLLQEKVKEIIDLPIIKEKVTVDEWFTKWLNTYIKPLKKEATYNQYSTLYKQYIKPVIGKRLLKDIKSNDIQLVISKMSNETRKVKRKNKETKEWIVIDTGEKLSTWTMKHTRKIMNGAFIKARKDKYIAESPVQDIEIPKRQAKPRKTLTVQEVAKLFDAMKNSRWIWSAKFMLVTGSRRGELLALNWTDIDFFNNRITVDESNSSTGIGDTKSSKVHYIPLSKKANEFLEGQIFMLKKEGNPVVSDDDFKNSSGLIFPNRHGDMLKPGSYYTLLSRFAAKVGIKASPHCLRHTFVYLARETMSIKDIQYILGHDESTTTLDIYGDILSDSTKKVADQIDDIFNLISFEVKKAKVIKFDFQKAK